MSVFISISVVVLTSSLPIVQELLDERGATTWLHSHTSGSLQYGAPLPFFQCCAHAQAALAGKSLCFGPFWWGLLDVEVGGLDEVLWF